MTGRHISFVNELARLERDREFYQEKYLETKLIKYQKQLNKVLDKIKEVEDEMS